MLYCAVTLRDDPTFWRVIRRRLDAEGVEPVHDPERIYLHPQYSISTLSWYVQQAAYGARIYGAFSTTESYCVLENASLILPTELCRAEVRRRLARVMRGGCEDFVVIPQRDIV